jgi:RHS repeat-associated protein
LSKQIIHSDNKHLNLPKRIEITDADGHQIYFRYNSFGKKLRKQNQTYRVISSNNGNLIEKLSFDPCSVTPGFGFANSPNPMVELIPPMKRRREEQRRNPNDWTFTNVPTTFLFDRGYPGHKHLDKFNLINMNGRVYDPFVARFLSPDPFVQATDYTQSYNRYSYCLNNPLKYTDPSGYEPNPSDFAGNVWMTSYQHHIGPGSNNHWSDQFRSQDYNFMLMSGEAFKDKYGEEKYNDSFDRVMNSNRNNFSDLADAYNDGMDIYLIDAFGRTNVVSSFGSLGETITSENGGISFFKFYCRSSFILDSPGRRGLVNSS